MRKRVRRSAGDNILTAVNVAKSCGMVGCHERVVFVNATPHTASSGPTLTFNLEDEGHDSFQSSADILTQVGEVILHHCGFFRVYVKANGEVWFLGQVGLV